MEIIIKISALIYGVLCITVAIKFIFFAEKKEEQEQQEQKPKPIFIVTLPYETEAEDCNYVRDQLTSIMKDYNILVTIGRLEQEQVTYRCFYEKDFNKVKYEELKEIIKDTLGKKSL